MVRSKWTTATVVAGLACAGLTFASLGRGEQASSKAPGGVNPAEIVTINEPGKPAQQCVIQKSTRLPDGKIAHEVRNLTTGEVTTLYMEDTGKAKGQTSTVPWANSKSASPAFENNIAQGSWSPSGGTKSATSPVVPKTQAQPISRVAGEYRTIDEPGKAPLQCRVILQWQTPEGRKASQLQVADTGEYLTIVEAGTSTTNNDKVTAQLYRWGTSKTPPPGVPVPRAAIATAPVATKSTEAKKNIDQSIAKLEDNVNGSLVVPRPFELALPNVAMKPADQPGMPETTNSTGDSKQLELPKLPAMPKTAEPATPGILAVPDPAKVKATVPPPPPPLPLPPPVISGEPKKASPDLKLPGVGKPSADSTLPTDGKPSLPSGPPTLPVPTAGPSASSLPPTLTQLALGNSLSNQPSANVTPGSLGAVTRKNDPLANPESLLPGRNDKDSVKAPRVGTVLATDGGRIPLGAGSVAAAGDPRFLPVPMVTIPQANPPMPPMLPAMLPTSNPGTPTMEPEQFVNAFTTAAPGQYQQQNAMQQPMLTPGYGMPMMPNQVQSSYRGPMPPNPVVGMQGYSMPTMPQGYSMPMMPQGYPMMMPPPGYQMPLMPQGYPVQMMPLQPAMGYSNPAMDRPGMPVTGPTTMQQSLNVLKSSLYPTSREQAVMQLCTCNPNANPAVVQLLLTTAKEDPSATVRAACVSGLARMGVASEMAVATYTQLKTDADPRVRQEAEQALARTATANSWQPVGAVNRQ